MCICDWVLNELDLLVACILFGYGWNYDWTSGPLELEIALEVHWKWSIKVLVDWVMLGCIVCVFGKEFALDV